MLEEMIVTCMVSNSSENKLCVTSSSKQNLTRQNVDNAEVNDFYESGTNEARENILLKS